MKPLLLFFLAFGISAACISAEAVKVGAAAIDVTPGYPVRLNGYAVRKGPSEGVEQKLFAKALAIGSEKDGNLTVILTLDNLGAPASLVEKVYDGVAAKVKLRREQFAVCASHTHSAPMLSGMCSNIFGMDLPDEQWSTINRYTSETAEKMVKAALEAVGNAKPGELYWGIGKAGFAKNRRTEGGPVDHDVPVLAAKVDGKWAAILANYACHCTTLGGGFNKTCGDWAGYAQEGIEARFPGAVGLVAIGCGADSNPHPRGSLELAQQHGKGLATEVGRLLEGSLKRLSSEPQGKLERLKLAFDTLPTREHWQERAKDTGAIGYHARKNLARLDRGETLPTELPYSVQVMSFGSELAMVFLPGEVVVDYALRIKKTYEANRVWVNAYANDEQCYIPSKRIWTEGGYEGGGAMIYYDWPTRLAEDTEGRIFAVIERLLPTPFRR